MEETVPTETFNLLAISCVNNPTLSLTNVKKKSSINVYFLSGPGLFFLMFSGLALDESCPL